MFLKKGVAEPRIIGILIIWALLIAMSLAENLKPSCCLYEASCSSSTIMSPSLGAGIIAAERVPIITLISPLRNFFQVLYRAMASFWNGKSLPNLQIDLSPCSQVEALRAISGAKTKTDLLFNNCS